MFYLEIKSNEGGQESSFFAKEIFNLYKKILNKKNIKFNILLYNINNKNELKNGIFSIYSKKIYNLFKKEIGIHRVQRIPKNEKRNRIHTSFISVTIFKIKKTNIKILEKDLKFNTFKSSGAGGQHVNKTNSAVRITHIPTGICVKCQNERSQYRNKKEALKLLELKIYNKVKNTLKFKKKKIIKTYNFIKNIVFINKTKKFINLKNILNGKL
ncbi:peptide chain release factor-like protein [Candidatus Vidania fulgoroideorum]